MMSLDEAIIHTQKKAEELERNAEHIKATMKSDIALQNAKDCIECANEHKQLGKWLTELKERRSNDRPRGHWVFDPDGMDWGLSAWLCSECHCKNDNISPAAENPYLFAGSKFCPQCGAKMDGRATRREAKHD